MSYEADQLKRPWLDGHQHNTCEIKFDTGAWLHRLWVIKTSNLMKCVHPNDI